MGCPPSPEEKEEHNSRESIRDSESRILKLKNDLDAFLKIMRKFEGIDHLSNDMRLSLKTIREESLSSISMIGSQQASIPSMNEDTDYHAFLSHLYSIARENDRKEKELETVLCNSRSKLINLLKGQDELFANFSKEIGILKEEYKKHRSLDKKQWLVWLQAQLDVCQSIINEKEEPETVIKRSMILAKKIEAEMKRTKGLSEAEILVDSAAFGRSSELFDPFKVLFQP